MRRYLICPLMENQSHKEILHFISKSLECKKIINVRCSYRKILLVSNWSYILKLTREDINQLWYSSVQRQVRRNKKGNFNFIKALLIFMRSFLWLNFLTQFKDKSYIVTTCEPYIESYVLRVFAKIHNQKILSYMARDFLAIQSHYAKYKPNIVNIYKLSKLLSDIDKHPQNNADAHEIVTYNNGGTYIGCSRIDNNPTKIELEFIDDSYIIFLHDFLDAPGLWGKGIFGTMKNWLVFTINYLRSIDIDFYIKPHPNEIAESIIIREEILSRLKISPSQILECSTKLILSNKPRCVVSDHGSILLESMSLGIPCAYSGQSLSTHLGILPMVRNVNQYKKILLNPVTSHYRANVIHSFIENINDYVFDYKFDIPVTSNFDSRFLALKPISDASLRVICENSDLHTEILHATLQSDQGHLLANCVKHEFEG